MKKILIASYNSGKRREVSSYLSGLGFEVLAPSDVSAVSGLEVDETGQTICENAVLKASEFAVRSGLLTLADDSSFEIHNLDGFPGVHAKRFLDGSDQDRNLEILRRMKKVPDRAAQFRTCLALIDPDQDMLSKTFTGVVSGQIADTIRGKTGFAYDRIFMPSGYDQTFAELGQDIKNKLSHRARALEKLKKYLQEKYAN